MIQSPIRDAQGSMKDPQARSARILEALFPDRRERDFQLVVTACPRLPVEEIERIVGGSRG